MMTFVYPDPIPLGDDVRIPFALTNKDGTPYDYTGHTLEFFLSRTLADTGSYVVTKTTVAGIEAVSPALGTGNLVFAFDDPIPAGSYHYSFRDQTARVTLTIGTIAFADHPGR